MDYKITDPKLQYSAGRKALNPSRVAGIALHHVHHERMTLQDFHEQHKNDPKVGHGFAYGYYVDFQGTIYLGRGLAFQHAGVGGQNDTVFSIAFQGAYGTTTQAMPDDQYNAGVWLVNWLRPQLPSLRVIHGHKYFSSTACPGQYFPLAEMITGKYRGQQPIVAPDPLEADLQIIQAAGIQLDPAYWLRNAVSGKTVKGEFARTLVQRFAEHLRGKE